MANHGRKEGMRLARLLMVLSSISPLFIIWAIRGTTLVADEYFISLCSLMVAAPSGFLAWRLHTARKLREARQLAVGTAEDHRKHLLVYLFAILLTFYSADLSSWRELSAAVGALMFIIFLFWYLNLHYINLVFALCGYHVFTVQSPQDGNVQSGKLSYVLITPRMLLSSGETIKAYRLSNTIYIEWKG